MSLVPVAHLNTSDILWFNVNRRTLGLLPSYWKEIGSPLKVLNTTKYIDPRRHELHFLKRVRLRGDIGLHAGHSPLGLRSTPESRDSGGSSTKLKMTVHNR